MNQGIAISPLDPTLRSAFVSSEPEAEPRVKLDLVRSLKMHRTAAAVVAACVLAGLIIFGLLQRPQFEAQSLIYIQPATPKPLTDVTPGLYDSSRYDSYIQQQLQTIVREDILADALKKMPDGTWQLPGESEESAIARLRASLKVERMLSSYEVAISLKGANAASVTRVVNEVTAAFLNKGRGDELAQNEQQAQSLVGERERIASDLARDRKEQAALSTSLGVADTSSETTGNPYDVQLQDLRSQVSLARQAHAVALAQLAAASKGAGASALLNAASDDVTATDPALNALRVSITERRSALALQMAAMTQANPIYKQDEEELARLDDSVASLSQGLRKKASQQLEAKWKLEEARTGSILARLQAQLAEQTAIATGATPKLQRAADLAADIARLQARFTESDNAIHSLDLQQGSTGSVHLSLAATEPHKAVAGKRELVLATALPIALLCGAIVALLMQKLDPKVYIAEDVKSALRFQPMVVLPHPEEVDSSVMDEYMLRLVAGIDRAHRVGMARTFVFTGASPGMKTTGLVESLAKRMNEIGYEVVVSQASAALKSRKREAAAQEAPEPEGGPSIDAGSNAQLMRVKEQSLMVGTLNRGTQGVNMLFIDALPLLCSAEAEFDTRLVDVTVVLAESGRTTRRDLSRSLSLIQRLTNAGVAAVLMDLRLRHADSDFLSSLQNRASTA